jgi:nitrate/TMAO reductase-like tetraheme cytochrome c subunit
LGETDLLNSKKDRRPISNKEDKKMIKARLITLVAGVFFLSTVWCQAAEKEGNNAKALFENNCGKCHNLDRPKAKKKTKDEWETTVLRMKKSGAMITDDEAKLIISYLFDTYKK